MKILLLLFAVVFLVFQTSSEAAAVANNEAEAQAPDQVQAEAPDEIMAEDAAAEIASPDRGRFLRPTVCQIGGGVCRRGCLFSEYPSGWCFTGMYCCKRK